MNKYLQPSNDYFKKPKYRPKKTPLKIQKETSFPTKTHNQTLSISTRFPENKSKHLNKRNAILNENNEIKFDLKTAFDWKETDSNDSDVD